MHNIIKRKSFVVCLVQLMVYALFVSSVSFADKVFLTNGRSLEGIVEKEDQESIVLNIGAGTTTIKKSEIDRIERDNAKDRSELEKSWTVKYFAREDFTPARLQELGASFRQLSKSRNLAIKSSREKDSYLLTMKSLEAQLKELRNEIVPISEKLSKMEPKENVTEYNSLITEYNGLANRIQLLTAEASTLEEKMTHLDVKINTYSNNLSDTESEYRKVYSALKGKLNEDEKFFLEELERNFNKMKEDFSSSFVQYTQDDSSIIVPVLLNNSLKAEFVVDTGASIVMLSDHIAHRLGITTDQRVKYLSITLGDGREVNAFPVVLNNIKVGDAEVDNVRAAVLIDSTNVDFDGLLGMSFLENFAVKIDGKSKKLILEEFEL